MLLLLVVVLLVVDTLPTIWLSLVVSLFTIITIIVAVQRVLEVRWIEILEQYNLLISFPK